MTLPLGPDTAYTAVIWGGLVLGLLLGITGQASRFCVRGAIADWYLSGSRGRMLHWVLVVAVAAGATQILVAFQAFDASRTLAWSERFAWASYLIGGGLFGFGMVLAAGCPQRSLVKVGAGNLKAIVTLLVAALAAQMTLRGVFAEARVATLDAWSVPLGGPQDLGAVLAQWLPLAAAPLRLAVVALLLAGAGCWLWRRRGDLTSVQWIAGIAIGLLVPAAWLLTGWIGFLPEHPETLEPAWQGTQSHRPEALSFTAPIAHALDLLTLWTDKSMTASFGVMLALGVPLGSFVSARWRGEFRIESFGSEKELRDHLLGGVLMGIGGVTAAGCSVGQGVSGLAMLSCGALVAVVGITLGALAALKLQTTAPKTSP
ncbi:MAG TPA: YeeE/YedE family protein [Methylibium sp.]|nr:YeeE/YedE family protein [Methylibium sp.]